MDQDKISLSVIIQDLLLNYALTKREIARYARMSYHLVNQWLEFAQVRAPRLKQEQEHQLLKLYARLKAHGDQVEEFLVPMFQHRPRYELNEKSKEDKCSKVETGEKFPPV